MSRTATNNNPSLVLIAAAVVTTTAAATTVWMLPNVQSWWKNRGIKSNSDDEDKNGSSRRRRQRQQQQRSATELRSRFRASNPTRGQVVCAPTAREFDACLHDLCPEQTVLLVRGTRVVELEETLLQLARKLVLFEGSVWDFDSLQRTVSSSITASTSIDVIVLDPANIQGNDIFMDSVVLVRILQALFQPKQILIKSRVLTQHARAYKTLPQLKQQQQQQQENTTTNNTDEELQIVCTVGVSDYRTTMEYLVHNETDWVLELGCHFGTTTLLLANQLVAVQQQPTTTTTTTPNACTGHAVGVDVGKVCIERARQNVQKNHIILDNSKHKNVSFEIADAWDTKTLLQLGDGHGFNLIYVDVGGISGSDGELEGMALIRQLICAFGSNENNKEWRNLRAIVVKSRCLRDHAGEWIHSDQLLRKNQRSSPTATATM